MAKKVSDAKLVRASKSLLALVECEDYDEAILALREAHEDRHWREGSSGSFDDHAFLSSDTLVRVAQVFSIMATPDID
jgi:hypothetical protein